MAAIQALPTLAHSRWLRFLTLGVMYSAQGLPFGFFTIAIPSWMANQGFAATEIASFIGVVMLPWSLKLIAAPVMDRWGYAPMGYRRPWILAAQAGVMLSFFGFGLIPTELFWMSAIGCLTNTFAASQDVAVDGLAIDILPDTDRARANGFMFGGQFLGISLGSSGGGYALLYLGVGGVGLLAGLIMLLILLFPVLLLERPGERRFPWSPGQASKRDAVAASTVALLKGTATALLLPASLILFFNQFGTRLAEGVVIAHLPIYTVQTLGLADTTYNDFSTAGGISAAILGVLVSPWFDKVRAHNAFWLTCWLFVAVIALLPFTLEQWPMISIVAHWVTLHLMGITLTATMMRFCHPAFAATQFAIFMAMANLNYSMGAFLYAEIVTFMDSTEVLLFAAALGAMGLPLWYVLVSRYIDATAPAGAQPDNSG